ncbi:hypothetical protein OH807_26375 [Kitasatospora sp. NBC_01560]|uniref:hypothetical protein n=1 Tax=Kitasatospora sp. NBC_01560 TaxID=2975965 RepID=UPI003868F1F4
MPPAAASTAEPVEEVDAAVGPEEAPAVTDADTDADVVALGEPEVDDVGADGVVEVDDVGVDGVVDVDGVGVVEADDVGLDGVGLGEVLTAGQVCERLNHFTSPPLTSALAEVSVAPGADPT